MRGHWTGNLRRSPQIYKMKIESGNGLNIAELLAELGNDFNNSIKDLKQEIVNVEKVSQK